ncbi:Homeobox protein Wariai [Colletotrichum aenigma]|uniref:Homeobox protein Wariai n=1 Tax=Colletotrichum aenigma TaxID=1215731 RepID=UPI0018721B19|nr:Homeobox protein Wariai [Colletotrichum aenigma]KAF5523621.1 Homeobox protein Wariai [Colletotrichum aenigma]
MNATSPNSTPAADAEQIRLMKERIHLLKEVNETLYQNTHPVDDRKTRRNLSEAAQFARLPPLPPTLPRPEYSLTADLISLDDEEVRFYVACENGSVEEVASFVQQTNSPSQAVLQHGLEQASFGNQPAVARFLLERGTPLHGNIFSRARRVKTKDRPFYLEDVTIFDETQSGGEDTLIPLIRVFLDFGWHPNQAWRGATSNEGKTPLPYEGCIANTPLVQLLLQHGANPNIAADSRSPDGEDPRPNRHGGDALNSSARLGDTRLFNLLLSHGADPSFASPLHSIVSCQIMPADLRGSWLDAHSFASTPFSPRRRAMAEHILACGAAAINDVRRLLYCDILDRQPGDSYETTAFARACAGQDWEFAEWLLEKGADPGLCLGLALLRQYRSEPWVGPTEPETVRELIERVKGRKA